MKKVISENEAQWKSENLQKGIWHLEKLIRRKDQYQYYPSIAPKRKIVQPEYKSIFSRMCVLQKVRNDFSIAHDLGPLFMTPQSLCNLKFPLVSQIGFQL